MLDESKMILRPMGLKQITPFLWGKKISNDLDHSYFAIEDCTSNNITSAQSK